LVFVFRELPKNVPSPTKLASFVEVGKGLPQNSPGTVGIVQTRIPTQRVFTGRGNNGQHTAVFEPLLDRCCRPMSWRTLSAPCANGARTRTTTPALPARTAQAAGAKRVPAPRLASVSLARSSTGVRCTVASASWRPKRTRSLAAHASSKTALGRTALGGACCNRMASSTRARTSGTSAATPQRRPRHRLMFNPEELVP